MERRSSLFDELLRLGDAIVKAAEAKQWQRLSELVEERARVVERVTSTHTEGTNAFRSEHEETRRALMEQHRRLMTILQKRRDDVSDTLAQVEHLNHALDSYETKSEPRRILHADLEG
jgi:hypothetical protein